MKKTIIVAAIATLSSATSFADSTLLETITVNADFRSAEDQKTPISLTTIDIDQIEQRGAKHLEDIVNLAPNINFSSGASRGKYFQIRGIGERSQFSSPINPSVGLIIDGIDLSHSAGAATLFDIEQVDILRGPQGTRYGANALAGVINLQSTPPSEDFSVHMESTLASYNTRSLGIAVGGSLIDNTLLGRASIHQHKSDGYIDNNYLNRDNTNNQDELTVRGHLTWLASDDFTADLNLLHINTDNGYDAFTFDNSRNTLSDEPGVDSQQTNAISVQTGWDMSNALRLETNIAHADSNLEYSYDEDWSFVGQFADDLYPYSSFDQYLRERRHDTVEIRALSNEAGRLFNGKSDWVVGIYHAVLQEGLERNYTYLDSPFTSDYKTKNTAIYGQLDTAITAKTTLVTGLRVEQWRADYDDSNALVIDSDETLFGGKLGLNHQLNDDQFLFTSLSRGYKSGGVNTDGSLPINARDFDTEYLWNLEAGIKSTWLDGKLKSQLTAFYAQRKDQQVNSSLVVARDDGSTEFIGFLNNAAKGKNVGLEAEIDWLVNQNWRVFANLGLLNASFDEYDDPEGLAAGIDLSGRRQAHAPSYQFAAGAELYLGLNWTLRANVEGKDAFYFSDRHNAKSNSYALVNSSLEYRNDAWKMTLWARNLFDKDYAVRGFGSFGNNPGNGYMTETYVQQGQPRIVGLSLAYDY